MIQKRKKQIKIIIIIILILGLIAGGTLWFVHSKNNNEGNKTEQKENLKFTTKSLILKTAYKLENTYGATNVEELMENMYVLEYETEEQTENAYNELKKDKKIEYVMPDEEYKINDNITKRIIYYSDSTGNTLASWAGTAMGLDILQNKIDQKASVPNITIAVLDSGLDKEHTVITEKFSSMISDNQYNAIDRGSDVTDLNGHGTLMVGAILDCSPSNITILPVKILDDDGKAEGQSLIRAINYAIEQNVDVINMSLGSEPGTATPAGSLAIQEATERAIDAGIIVVAASGNGDENGIAYNMDIEGNEIYPASIPDVFTIGSVKNNLIQTDASGVITNSFDDYKKPDMLELEKSEFSNYGSVIDFVAPGENIIGIYPKTLSSSGIIIGSGTSQATAHMSAAVANILSYNKDFTNEQVYEILEYYAEDLGPEGRDTHYGNGFINFNDIQECTCNCAECDGIYCFGCTCEDCLFHEVPVKTLEEIEITTIPSKITYTEGETFNPTGMVVTAVYSDNTREPVTNYTYSPTGTLSTTDTKIIVSYQGKTAEIEITVKAKPVEKKLQGIEISTLPNKITYTEGETFNPTGMVVTAVYSDNTREPVTNYTYSPTGTLSTTDTKITVSYQGKTAEIEITVKAKPVEKILQEIEITTLPNKTIYTEGDNFDKTGLKVTAVYSDGSRKNIENYNCFPLTALTTSHTKITIQYTENGRTAIVTIPITVNAKNVDNNNNSNSNNNNNNNGNSNNNNSNNNQNQKPAEKPTDPTVKDEDLAFTGAETYIIPAIGITIVGMIAFIGYRKYKDI